MLNYLQAPRSLTRQVSSAIRSRLGADRNIGASRRDGGKVAPPNHHERFGGNRSLRASRRAVKATLPNDRDTHGNTPVDSLIELNPTVTGGDRAPGREPREQHPGQPSRLKPRAMAEDHFPGGVPRELRVDPPIDLNPTVTTGVRTAGRLPGEQRPDPSSSRRPEPFMTAGVCPSTELDTSTKVRGRTRRSSTFQKRMCSKPEPYPTEAAGSRSHERSTRAEQVRPSPEAHANAIVAAGRRTRGNSTGKKRSSRSPELNSAETVRVSNHRRPVNRKRARRCDIETPLKDAFYEPENIAGAENSQTRATRNPWLSGVISKNASTKTERALQVRGALVPPKSLCTKVLLPSSPKGPSTEPANTECQQITLLSLPNATDLESDCQIERTISSESGTSRAHSKSKIANHRSNREITSSDGGSLYSREVVRQTTTRGLPTPSGTSPCTNRSSEVRDSSTEVRIPSGTNATGPIGAHTSVSDAMHIPVKHTNNTSLVNSDAECFSRHRPAFRRVFSRSPVDLPDKEGALEYAPTQSSGEKRPDKCAPRKSPKRFREATTGNQKLTEVDDRSTIRGVFPTGI